MIPLIRTNTIMALTEHGLCVQLNTMCAVKSHLKSIWPKVVGPHIYLLWTDEENETHRGGHSLSQGTQEQVVDSPLLGHPHEVAENHPGNVSPMEPARLRF